MTGERPLSWLGIVRLGLVQMALGAIVAISTSTINRVMVIELALPAALPGALIALHYVLQLARPRLGHASDVGGRRTPWILGGMATLAVGAWLAAVATALMASHLVFGIGLGIIAFSLIGLGVAACGTTLLVLLAQRCAPERRPAAAVVAWVMMILGFILTAAVASKTLDPFSAHRLMLVVGMIGGTGLLVSCVAVLGIEHRTGSSHVAARSPFGPALREVWADPKARRFTLFVFVSMLAYGSEEFLIEPLAATAFAMTPGATAKLSGIVHGGTLGGMVLFALVSMILQRAGFRTTQGALIGGCLGSAIGLAAVAGIGAAGAPTALSPTLALLGLANGIYTGAAIGAMMLLVGAAGETREGVRMGLWGAAQALALGGGGVLATILIDATTSLFGIRADAYVAVLIAEAIAFVLAAILAARTAADTASRPRGVPADATPATGGRRRQMARRQAVHHQDGHHQEAR